MPAIRANPWQCADISKKRLVNIYALQGRNWHTFEKDDSDGDKSVTVLDPEIMKVDGANMTCSKGRKWRLSEDEILTRKKSKVSKCPHKNIHLPS